VKKDENSLELENRVFLDKTKIVLINYMGMELQYRPYLTLSKKQRRFDLNFDRFMDAFQLTMLTQAVPKLMLCVLNSITNVEIAMVD
jgi:hypothetical protein